MDEYSHITFKDEYYEETRSLDSNEDEEEVISTFHMEYEDEIQDFMNRQGFSPRGRKRIRHTTSWWNIGRGFTRSRSRGI